MLWKKRRTQQNLKLMCRHSHAVEFRLQSEMNESTMTLIPLHPNHNKLSSRQRQRQRQRQRPAMNINWKCAAMIFFMANSISTLSAFQSKSSTPWRSTTTSTSTSTSTTSTTTATGFVSTANPSAAMYHPSTHILSASKGGADSSKPTLQQSNSSMDKSDISKSKAGTNSNNKANSSNGQTASIKDLQIVNNEITTRMKSKSKINFQETRQLMNHMILLAGNEFTHSDQSFFVHDAFRQIASRTFNQRANWENVKFGLEMIDLQASFGDIPRSLCLQALKSLNSFMRKHYNGSNGHGSNSSSNGGSSLRMQEESRQQANAAYRILQRLCTGIGVIQKTCKKTGTKVQITLDERDFSMVLNGFVNIGDMNMAHRVVALQLRTEHAPPLSPVTFSILIKGYGHRNDIKSVDQVLANARMNDVDPDIIMYNSLIDAYINCNDVPKAFAVFNTFTRSRDGGSGALVDGVNIYVEHDTESDTESVFPTANLRTYNIMLKGFVKAEDMEKALLLSKEMEAVELWDTVTTNTLVGVAVATKNFELAESLLDRYTVSVTVPVPAEAILPSGTNSNSNYNSSRRLNRWHPNVEAYTELVGGYAKSGRLSKAMEIFKMMRHRGVNPNEYTYTCIIGALAKANKIDRAKQLLSFMADSDGIQPSIVTYNALLTGMLMAENKSVNNSNPHATDGRPNDEVNSIYNIAVDDALQLFGKMLNNGIYPNEITVSLLVDALGNCKPSRLDEAKALVGKMEKDGYIASNNARVATTLIRACARSSDLEGALTSYRAIEKPDVIAFNALLNAFCEGRRIKMAIDVLNANWKKKEKDLSYIIPDVATFTILISSLLKVGTVEASKAAYKLYKEMRNEWGVVPDAGVVDA